MTKKKDWDWVTPAKFRDHDYSKKQSKSYKNQKALPHYLQAAMI